MENKNKIIKLPLSPAKTVSYEHYDEREDVLYKVVDGKLEAIIDAPVKKEDPNG